jgi:hypothetical protein
MNSENSTQSESGIQLKSNHFDTIKLFVQKYDILYKDLGSLENDIQNLLKRQEVIVGDLEKTRVDEEEFFKRLAEETGKDIQYLKKLASTWVLENK